MFSIKITKRLVWILTLTALSLLAFVLLYRSGRVADSAFYVAGSQLLLVIMGVAVVIANNWVERHPWPVLGAFLIAGVIAFGATVKQSDEAKRESGAIVTKLDTIESHLSQPNADKDQIISEVQRLKQDLGHTQATTTASSVTTALPVLVPSFPTSSTRYSAMTNTELKRATASFVTELQGFSPRWNERPPTSALWEQQSNEMRKAKTDDERRAISRKYQEHDSKLYNNWYETRKVEFQKNYQARAINFRDTLRSRLPPNIPQASPVVGMYEYLNGPDPIGDIIRDLQRLADLLADEPVNLKR